jgi:hypothetical protein
LGNAYIWRPVDFIFQFANTNLAAGASAVTGSSADYYWRADNTQSSSAFGLDNESVAEISGIEIFGPNDGNRRQKFRYVTLIIDGKEQESIKFNELMAPGYVNGQIGPYGGGGRYGHASTNLGHPILAGGKPEDATPKIGPGDSLSLRVQGALATEGGEILNQPMRVRVWMLQCKGEEKLRSVLDYYHGQKGTGLYQGGSLDCGFVLGDLEDFESMPIKAFDKKIGSSGGFRLGDWTRVHGGNDCDKPKITNFITYAQNALSTTANSWYQFTQDGTKVTEDWQVLRYNYDKRDALRITHVGVKSHKDLRYIRLGRSGRSIDYIHECQMASNPLEMPGNQFINVPCNMGPTKLPRSFVVWNEIGSIEAEDNGTAIPAWSAANQGIMVALFGKKYELVE